MLSLILFVKLVFTFNWYQLTPKLEQLIEATRKQQAQQQAEDAQKVAKTAAWWLFSTIFFSASASAIAGSLAVLH